ncbi:MAG TPA: hypothetical protein VHA12_01780 [Candidatus Nanoarchaeia archaeon]|nr:hypothetical protein [Candidatus Nanoarchaeia archaeon]
MAHAMKKRGLSDVVTTVLIILLVLAAVAILGKYLLGFIQKGGTQISGATACSTLDLKPAACNVSANGASVTVRYERGSGVATLTNVTLIFSDATGATTLNYTSVIPAALESKTFSTATASRPVSVSLAGTVTTETGDSKLCEKTSAVQCT